MTEVDKERMFAEMRQKCVDERRQCRWYAAQIADTESNLQALKRAWDEHHREYLKADAWLAVNDGRTKMVAPSESGRRVREQKPLSPEEIRNELEKMDPATLKELLGL